MTNKISIFGPKDTLPQKESIESLARFISGESRIYEVSTGGIVGFPAEVLKQMKSLDSKQIFSAYSPCSCESEWDLYYEKGLTPSRDLFNNIFWVQQCYGNIKERALFRIPFLAKGNKANIAYLNGQGNTNLEVLSSLSLGTPTLCLTEQGEKEKWKDLFSQISRESKHLEVYSDVEELNYNLGRKL